MRLEDWQKWLDSQFIETPVADSQAAVPADQQQEYRAVEGARAFDTMQESHAAAGVATLAPPLLEREPGVSSREAEQRHVAEASGTDAIVEDMPMPAIEQYMPFLRREPVEAVVADAEPVPAPEPAREAMQEETAVASTPASADSTTEMESSAVEPPAVQESAEPQAMLPFTPAESAILAAPPSAPSRAGAMVRRARHARNSGAAALAPEIEIGELWRLVPKHIQVLVAIGSEEGEVAQNSYKRSFRESRIQLIDRLLDPSLSLEETARLLNVCPTTVRRYTNRGLLTHQRTPGDQRRFKLSDVLAFLEAQSRV